MIQLKNFCSNSISGVKAITFDESYLQKTINLSNEDKILIESCLSQKRRLELLNVRYLLELLDIKQSIRYVNEKPTVDDGYISISHSDKYVSVIWSKQQEYSIDIEPIHKRIHRISDRVFSDFELSFASDRTKILILLWNIKECIYKLLNISTMDYKHDIITDSFSDTDKFIYAKYIHKDVVRFFELEHIEIDNHSMAWCKEIKN